MIATAEGKPAAIKVSFTAKSTGKTSKYTFSSKVTIVDPKPAVTELSNVTQTRANTFELTFTQDVQTPGAIVITKDENQSNIDVKSVTPVKTDATKLTVETFVNLTDGKEYTFTYTTATDDKTVSSQKLVATDAVVASIAATPLNVTVNKATDISYQLLDKDGIVLEEKKFADKSSNIDITTVESDGYFNGSALLLLSEGATSKITIVYHSGKYDSEGTEATVKNDAIVITAVKDATTIAGYDYTIINSATRSNADFKKPVHQIAMEDTGMYAHFIIRNSKDEDVTNDVAYDLYKVESSDDAVLVAATTDMKNGVQLYPVKAGTAYLIIKDANGATVESLKVNVVAKRTLASFGLSKTSVTVATATAVNVAKDVIEIKDVKDQYGNDLTVTDWKQPVLKTAPSGVDVATYTNVSATLTGKKITIATTADATPGTYQFVVEGKFGDVTKSKAFSVNVKRVVGDETYAIVMTNGTADGTNVATTFDTTVKKDADSAKTIVANLAVVKNGVVYNTAQLNTSTVSLVAIQIVDPKGKTQLNTGAAVAAANVVSNTAIFEGVTATNSDIADDTTEIEMNAVSLNGTKLTKNMMAGTWTIKYTLRDTSGKLIPVSKSFVVEDKQNSITAEIKNQTIETGDAEEAFSSEKNIVFKNGAASILTTNGTADWTVETVKAKTTSDDQKILVESITILFKADGSATNALVVEVPVNKVFTTKAAKWSNINS